MNIKDILNQCKEQIKSFTQEDINNLKKNYDSMPDNKYYEPPTEIELIYSYHNWFEQESVIDISQDGYDFLYDNKENFYNESINQSSINKEYLAATA